MVLPQGDVDLVPSFTDSNFQFNKGRRAPDRFVHQLKQSIMADAGIVGLYNQLHEYVYACDAI